jgi:transcriptional regulator with XRE-family HTH domain
MTLAQYRALKKLTLGDMADQLDVKSKGYLSRVVNGEPCSIDLALRIEGWSEGAVAAESVVSPADRDLLRRIDQRASKPAPTEAHA